jgi:hypothetical protein
MIPGNWVWSSSTKPNFNFLGTFVAALSHKLLKIVYLASDIYVPFLITKLSYVLRASLNN